ncbi:MAG: hypothetical protein WC554_17155 [Clostridia bacterium]
MITYIENKTENQNKTPFQSEKDLFKTIIGAIRPARIIMADIKLSLIIFGLSVNICLLLYFIMNIIEDNAKQISPINENMILASFLFISLIKLVISCVKQFKTILFRFVKEYNKYIKN